MVEIRRGTSGDAARERLPWLEPVEDEDDAHYAGETVGYGGLILAALLVLVAIALLTGGVLWYRNHGGATGTGQIIAAEPGPYKVRPPNPGGMKPDADGEVTYGTSAGQDIDSPIDLSALPEQPMMAPGARNRPPAEQPVPTLPQSPRQSRPEPQRQAASQPAPGAPEPKPTPTPPEPVRKAPPPRIVASAPPGEAAVAAGGTGVVQLGAFSTEAGARAAWKSLSGRFAGLRDLGQSIARVDGGEKPLFRLRATGAADAARLCAQLRVAGESCAVVN